MQTEELTKRVEPIIERMETIKIEDDTTAKTAAEFLQKIKATERIVNDFFAEDIKAAHEAHKALTSERKFYLDKLTLAERTVKRKVADYRTEQERIQREETRRLTEEAQRKAEEAMLERAIETGDEAILDRVDEVKESVQVQAAPPEKMDGISYATTWDFEILDEKEIPREFMTPDLKKIKKYIQLHKGKYPVPGVKIIEDKQVRVS